MQYIVASERNAPYILQYSPLTHHIYCNVCFREQYIGILHILQYIVNILYIAYTVPHPWSKRKPNDDKGTDTFIAEAIKKLELSPEKINESRHSRQ